MSPRPGPLAALAGALAAVSAALLALTAGCAGDAGAGGTTVHFWAFGREGELVRELAPEFEAQNPGIRVEVQQIPWTAAHEKLLTAYVGESVPDAAQLGNTWVPEMVALEALAPLGHRVAASAHVEPADYFSGIWETNRVDGELWGVPWYVDTRLIFYRTDLVPADLWPPKSWGEWRQAMERIVAEADDPHRYAILLPIDEWQQPVVLALQSGSGLLDARGANGAFRTPRFRRAMAFYTGLYADGLAPLLDLQGISNMYQQLVEGAFAMVITGPWNLGEFRNRLPPELQDRWSTAPLPPPEPGMEYPGAALAGGSSLVLFRQARSPEAAWKWIEFLSAPAQQARFARLSGDLPARHSAWRLSGLADDPQAAAFLAQLEHVVPTPKVPEWERIATRVAECAEQIARGGRDLDAALAELDSDIDRILAKRRWMLERDAGEAAR